MELRLKFPPLPDQAMRFARDIADTHREASGETLDFSLDSVHLVDALLEEWHEQGLTSDEVAETLFSFGCYVGEVLRLEAGGQWVAPAQTPRPDRFGWPLVLSTMGSWWDPIGQVFERLDNGADDSLAVFCETVLNRAG